MKPIPTIVLVGAALISPTITQASSYEAGIDTYKQIEYSVRKPIHESICKRLEFVKITTNGVVVMRYTTDQTYFVYASPGEYLRGECGNIGFKVISINAPLGCALIEYLHSTTRPTL